MSSDPILGRQQPQQQQQSKKKKRLATKINAGVSTIDLLPDVRDVVRSVQKIQHDNLLAFTMQKRAQDEQEFHWVQGASNNRLFVDTFMVKLAGNIVHKFWHKQRLISTLQAVEHVYAEVLNMDEPSEVLVAFEWYHAWLPHASNKEFPVEVSTVAKLLNCFAWMVITSFPTPSPVMPFVEVSYRCAQIISHPPEDSMKGKRVINWDNFYTAELRKRGLDGEVAPPDDDNVILFDPINISPEWFSLECPIDVYTRWWLQKANGKPHGFITQRVMGEFKFFLITVIARLKNDIDMVSTMQTKIMGSMATLAFAGISHAMRQVQSEYSLD